MNRSRIAFKAIEASFLIFIFLQSPTFFGCSQSVETQTIHDTTILIHHDTIPGPAFIRFVAMLNNSTASGIILLKLGNPLSQIIYSDANEIRW